MKNTFALAAASAVFGLAPGLHAQIIQVEIRGSVEFNAFTTGAFAGVPAGAPAVMRFRVDSANFVDSPNFPTRAYPIDAGTFTLKAGSATVGFVSPMPAGFPPSLVIRNNDPAVDGFVISRNVDFPVDVPIETGVSNCSLAFLRTFNTATVWPTRDILDTIGFYDFTNMSSYDWSINRGPGTPMGIVYQSIRLYFACLPDVASLGGALGSDDRLTADDVVAYLAAFFAGNLAVADLAQLGGAPGRDGQLTPDDLILFLSLFFTGC